METFVYVIAAIGLLAVIIGVVRPSPQERSESAAKAAAEPSSTAPIASDGAPSSPPTSLLGFVAGTFGFLAFLAFASAPITFLWSLDKPKGEGVSWWIIVAALISGSQFLATSVICSALERMERKLHGLPPSA
ncbi:MAG: hypothetical protein NTV21_14545 [Planctomycetota bacterium]|nr:hypothetical protein [Planctomycetota bacterium]